MIDCITFPRSQGEEVLHSKLHQGTVHSARCPLYHPAPGRPAAEGSWDHLIKERGRKEREGEKGRRTGKRRRKRRREGRDEGRGGKKGRKEGRALSCRTLTHLVMAGPEVRLNCYFLLLMDHLARAEPSSLVQIILKKAQLP